MKSTLNKLSATQVKAAKPQAKLIRLSDGGGLFLAIQPITKGGGKFWHWRFNSPQGKDSYASFGSLDDVSLADARVARKKARVDLRNGITPKMRKALDLQEQSNTFRVVAKDWYNLKSKGWSNKKHRDNIWNSLENDVFPHIGDTKVSEVTTREVLDIAQRVQKRGAYTTATAVLQRVQSILKYAVVTHLAETNVAAGLSEYVTIPKGAVGNFPALPPSDMGQLITKIDTDEKIWGLTRQALKLLSLSVLRPGELRLGEWSEIEWENNQWVIPAARMKMGRDHVVPLAPQAMQILERIKGLSGGGKYMFPAQRSLKNKTISDGTLNGALKRMGFTGIHCAHGFRSSFSTWANELAATPQGRKKGFTPDVVETQLAHAPKNKIRAAYNRAEYLPERERLLKEWADFLDTFRDKSGKVVPMRKKEVA